MLSKSRIKAYWEGGIDTTSKLSALPISTLKKNQHIESISLTCKYAGEDTVLYYTEILSRVVFWSIV